MKKLMTMIAAVATSFGLFAAASVDEGDRGTSFEGVTAPVALADAISNLTELNNAEGANLWGATAGATVTAYAGGKFSAARPQQFDPENPNVNYLAIDSSAAEVVRKSDAAPRDVNDGTLYFDSLVNLTVFDQAPEFGETSPKLAVWLQEKLDANDDPIATNLWVKVGGSNPYMCDPGEGDYSTLADKWARVTIKAMKITGSEIGFVLFVNQSAVAYREEDTMEYPNGLTPAAQVYADANQLFYAANLGTLIASVGFKGKGSVDDIVFTTLVPFNAAEDTKFQTITWTPAAVTEIRINGTTVENTGSYQAPITAGQPITVAWTGTDAYINGDKTITTPSADTAVNLTDDIKPAVAVINGKKMATIAAAVNEANKATEQAPALLKLITATAEDNIEIGNSYVLLDLNGQTIGNLGDYKETSGVVLSITNSNVVADGIVKGYVNYDVNVKVSNVKFDYTNNSDIIGGDLVTVTVPEGYELKPDAEYPHQYYVITAAPTDPIPSLPDNPTADQVNAAVEAANFTDSTVQEMIGGEAAKYNAFKTWADGVTGGQAAVVASPHAADSFLLGQTTLLQNAPASEIKTIAKTSDTALTLTFEIKDGANAVTVADSAKAYVASIVQCNEKVDFGNGTKIAADVTVTINGTTLTAAVALPANKPAAFMKVAK